VPEDFVSAERLHDSSTWIFSNIIFNTCVFQAGKGKDDPDRKLLEDVWGEVPSTQTTAIMGPSGAG